jgi:hypothetical protein
MIHKKQINISFRAGLIVVSIIVGILFLGGGGIIYYKYIQKEKATIKSEAQERIEIEKKKQEIQNAQYLFEMREKCAKSQKNINTPYEIFYSEIFYSPIKNTCVVAEKGMFKSGKYLMYFIFDYLDYEQSTTQYFFYQNTIEIENPKAYAMFNNVKGYLKGEEELKYDEVEWNPTKNLP